MQRILWYLLRSPINYSIWVPVQRPSVGWRMHLRQFCKTITPQGNSTQRIAVPEIVSLSLLSVLDSPSLCVVGLWVICIAWALGRSLFQFFTLFCLAAHANLNFLHTYMHTKYHNKQAVHLHMRAKIR